MNKSGHSILNNNTTFKRCSECNFGDVVYARTKNCPECKSKGTMEVDKSMNMKLRERECECGCGEIVYAPKRFVSGHNLKRRHPNAVVKNGRSYFHIRCSECGKRFLRRIDQINRRGLRNFCSSKCSSKNNGRKMRGVPQYQNRNGSYVTCLNCKGEFYVSRSRLKKKPKYCSKKCMTERRNRLGLVSPNFIGSADNRGSNNGRYKHGRRVGGHIQKKELRQKVIERDGGNWCLFCGVPGPGLHLHRIEYGAQGGKYVLDNVVQLCPQDHALVHSSKKLWKPILERYIETRELELPKDFHDDFNKRI